MAWTPIASTYGYSVDSGTVLDAAATLHIEVGDVLCVYTGWMGDTTTIAVATSDAAETFSMSAVQMAGTRNGGAIGWVQVGTHNAAATVRMTVGAARTKRAFSVMQFRPDAGDTVTYVAGPGAASASSGSAPTSANISPSGTDLLCFGGSYNAAGAGTANEQIGDVAADGTQDAGNSLGGWYKLYTSNQTNIHAQSTFGDDDSWTCHIIALESAAGGGGEVSIAAYTTYFANMRLRNKMHTDDSDLL